MPFHYHDYLAPSVINTSSFSYDQACPTCHEKTDIQHFTCPHCKAVDFCSAECAENNQLHRYTICDWINVNAKPVEEEELDERFLHPDYFEGSYGYFQHMPRNYFPFFEYRKQWLDKRGKAEFKAWCKDKTKELALLAKHILSELPPAAYTESEHILVLHVGGDWTTYIFNEDKDMSKHLLPEPSDETWKEHKVENEISFKLLGYETHMVSNINKEKEAFARGCGGTGTLFDLSVFSFLYVAHEIYANDSYDGTAKLAYDTEFAFRTISDVKPRVSCGNEEPDWLQGTPEEIVSYINSL